MDSILDKEDVRKNGAQFGVEMRENEPKQNTKK